jgi:hypothetical protein
MEGFIMVNIKLVNPSIRVKDMFDDLTNYLGNFFFRVRLDSSLTKVKAGLNTYVIGEGLEVPGFYDGWGNGVGPVERKLFSVRKFGGVTYVYATKGCHEHDRLRFAGVDKDFYEVRWNCSTGSYYVERPIAPTVPYKGFWSEHSLPVETYFLVSTVPSDDTVQLLTSALKKTSCEYSLEDFHNLFYHTSVFADAHDLSDLPDEYVRLLTAGVDSLGEDRATLLL